MRKRFKTKTPTKKKSYEKFKTKRRKTETQYNPSRILRCRVHPSPKNQKQNIPEHKFSIPFIQTSNKITSKRKMEAERKKKTLGARGEKESRGSGRSRKVAREDRKPHFRVSIRFDSCGLFPVVHKKRMKNKWGWRKRDEGEIENLLSKFFVFSS